LRLGNAALTVELSEKTDTTGAYGFEDGEMAPLGGNLVEGRQHVHPAPNVAHWIG